MMVSNMHSDETKEDHYNCLPLQNYEEIFTTDQETWFVDDTNVYRVTMHKTNEGNLTTKPINGASSIFNPRTGQLFLRITHTSEWEGEKRLLQLAKTKTTGDVTSLLQALSIDEHPNQIITTCKGMVDPIKVALKHDFPNVVVRGSDLKLPLHAYLKIDKFVELIMNATAPQMLQFNFYDNWLSVVSPYTAFSRLILILRALHVNKELAEMLLKPDETIVTKPDHIWPSLTDEQWMEVEVILRDLVASDDDILKHDDIVNTSTLTQAGIRDTILGWRTPASSQLCDGVIGVDELVLTYLESRDPTVGADELALTYLEARDRTGIKTSELKRDLS